MSGDHPEMGTGGMWLTEGRVMIHFGSPADTYEMVEIESTPIRWWHRFTRWFER